MEKAKSILLQVLPVTFATILVVAIIYAWVEPSSAPPTGNVPAPINVGSSQQWKQGGLGVGAKTFDLSSGQIAASTFYDRDNKDWLVNPAGPTLLKGLGIGATTTPAYTLDVTGTLRATATTTFSGNVGIGTTTPQTTLDVNGTTTIRKSLVVGNPTGGAKEAGSINAEKIYVGGSEVVSGASIGVSGTNPTCPSGYELVLYRQNGSCTGTGLCSSWPLVYCSCSCSVNPVWVTSATFTSCTCGCSASGAWGSCSGNAQCTPANWDKAVCVKF